MLRQQHRIFKRLNNLADAAITAFAFILAYQVRTNLATTAGWQHLGPLADFGYYSTVFILSCLIWPMLLNLNGLYPIYRTKKLTAELNIIFWSSIEATLLVIAITYIFQLALISRLLILGFAASNMLLLMCKQSLLKFYYSFMRKRGKDLRHTILVGDFKSSAEVIDILEGHPERGFKIVGIVNLTDQDNIPDNFKNIPVLGQISDIKQIIHRTPSDQVIFTVERKSFPQIEKAMYICEEEGLETWLAPDFFELNLSRMELEEIGGVSFLVFRTAPPLSWQMVIKYFVGFFFALLLLIILSPIFIITAVVIKLSSSGPVFYVQERIGLRGRPFKLYKFRSMSNGEITKLGNFIRKAGIDELPQLMNILRGDMSFVGPRPHVPEEVKLYAHGWQRRRLSMRPGLTCFRQISAPEKVTFDKAMELDLKYIDHWSLWVDISIIFKTIPLIISRFLKGNIKS